jgi:hypothetical protein
MFLLCGRGDRPYLNYEDRGFAGCNDGIRVCRRRLYSEDLENSVRENYSFLVVVESAMTKHSEAVLSSFQWGGLFLRLRDFKRFNLLFDFVCERRRAGAVYDPMIECQ